MRIAYVGNFEPEWSTENDVRLAFESLGHELIPLQENKIKYSELRRQALISDLLLWTGTWDDAQPLDESLTTFHACARVGVPTATLHLDTFWPTNRGNRAWWLSPMFHTGTIFTADGDHQAEWRRLGKQHVWLPPAVRHTVVDQPGEYRSEFACDVAFVGSNGINYHEDVWPYRRQLILALKEMCTRRGWSFRNPGGDHEKVPREAMADFYASAKITVGDSLCVKKEKAHYWSDRVYEATGRAGLLIMPHIDAVYNEFDGYMPSYVWGDWEDLEAQIEHYLANNVLNLETRTHCRDITAAKHTYVNRAIDILNRTAQVR